MLVDDLSRGTDVRGDEAYFIDVKHFSQSQWEVDEEAALENDEPTFFRVIDNREQLKGHGWLEGNKVVQWG